VNLLNSPDGRLHHDTQFSWDTFGVHIDSHVHEFVLGTRIGWFGRGTGMDAYHAFLLVKALAGCRVVTKEVVRGTGAVEFRKNDPNAMHRGHDLWLSSLKHVSAPSPPVSRTPLSPGSLVHVDPAHDGAQAVNALTNPGQILKGV
jgi:hypothetical protein